MPTKRRWRHSPRHLDAARGTGPAPARRAVPIDLDEFGSHLDGPGGGFASGGALPDDWDDTVAWLPVEPRGARGAHRDMEAFAAGVADRRLADRLERCLHGQGAFRRFRELLAARDDEWSRWQVFAAERVRGRARAWLAAHGFRPGPPHPGEDG